MNHLAILKFIPNALFYLHTANGHTLKIQLIFSVQFAKCAGLKEILVQCFFV